MDTSVDSMLDCDNKSNGEIREELSHMSFEDLQKLKEKLGSKVYNSTMFGSRPINKRTFRIESRDKPTEMSAKKPVSRFMQAIRVKKHAARDPRFDTLCGTYNEKAFKNAYSFLDKAKENDLKTLKEELKTTEDPKTIKKIKYLIQRLENQLREESRKKQREESKKAEQKAIIEAIERGEKPQYKKKSEKKILDLVSQYEELKNTGKLKKHIQRLRKKSAGKDKKRFAASSED
ncbi:hypothetical protein PV325_005452 [Microctonus aethiopoides]|uniref:rRNA biogenesis protein RRP36 n=1 Tax=Microctonus aethiopoides TaxID=144406 RepID=A0AA39F886_9HYME|nr:hypothetical protein PV325_005452 [Microctonus aethiopoides]KAK0096449.1 hypothetical protein PV326_005452 [Microctonus aethiopoides]KAK0164765.1 hypothetical protein PV328_003343 [Microctonus aethiopoides]